MPLAAREVRAVLAADEVEPALGDESGEPRALEGGLYALGREVSEHGDVLLYGAVENEALLLDDGEQLVERGGGDVPQLRAVQAYAALVALVMSEQQLQ